MNGAPTSRLSVEDGVDVHDRPAADRASLADEMRRIRGAQAAVTAWVDSHRRPPLQAHHALRSAEERVYSGTCCELYVAATIAVTKCVVDGRRW
jgi:hypothetical protein